MAGGMCMAEEYACLGGVHAREGGMCAWGACIPGVECACLGGIHGRGHAWLGDMHGQGGMRGRRDGHCSGRYKSYWNAFLLFRSELINSGHKPVPHQRGKCWRHAQFLAKC